MYAQLLSWFRYLKLMNNSKYMIVFGGGCCEFDSFVSFSNFSYFFFALHLPQFLVNYIKGELHMGHYITHIPLVQVYK